MNHHFIPELIRRMLKSKLLSNLVTMKSWKERFSSALGVTCHMKSHFIYAHGGTQGYDTEGTSGPCILNFWWSISWYHLQLHRLQLFSFGGYAINRIGVAHGILPDRIGSKEITTGEAIADRHMVGPSWMGYWRGAIQKKAKFRLIHTTTCGFEF